MIASVILFGWLLIDGKSFRKQLLLDRLTALALGSDAICVIINIEMTIDKKQHIYTTKGDKFDFTLLLY